MSHHSFKYLILCFTILHFPLTVCSLDDPYFRFWTAKDGFAETFVLYVNRGPQGDVIASGANVFHHSLLDGYRVMSLPAPYMHAFFQQDADGTIWSYLTDRKLGAGQKFLGFQRFNRSLQKWEPYPLPDFPGLIHDSTSGIQVSYIGTRPEGRFVCHPSGQLIFSHYDKVYSYWPESKILDVILNATDTEMVKNYDWSSDTEGFQWRLFGTDRYPGNVYLTKDNGIWVSSGGGIIKGDWDTSPTPPQWKWTEYPFPDDLRKTSFYLFHLIERSDGSLFGKSYIYNETGYTGTRLLQLRDNRWTAITDQEKANYSFGWKDDQNRLWHAYDGQTFIQDGTKETVVFPDLFIDIAFESDSQFFAGSDFGLLRYTEPLWSTPDALQDIDSWVKGITEDSNGTIWISNFNRLISYHKNKIDIYVADYPFSYVHKSGLVHAFSDNRIAIELFSAPESSIYVFDQNTKQFSPLLHPSGEQLDAFLSKDENIWTLSIDPKENRFLRIYQYDGKKFTTILDMVDVLRNLGTFLIYSVVQTNNGDFWLGTTRPFGPILYRKSGERILFDDRRTFPGTGSFQLQKVGNNRIWCAGKNEVTEYDGNTWRLVATGIDSARDFLQDRHGRIWIAAGNGVHCYNPHFHSWVHYTVEDGLPINNASNLFEDSRGNIWASTTKGISKFNSNSDVSPPIVWMVPEKNSNTITSDGNAQFVFDGIDKWKQTQKERLLYSYRIDKGEWSEFQSDNVAAFKAIAPGRHTFQVRSMDLNWNISESPAIHSFQVMYPWYRDPKVVLLMSISLFLALLFAGIAINRHLKLNRYSHRLEISNTQLNSMNAELQEANARLLQLDQMKSAFVSQASHDLRTPLTAIKSSLDNILRGVGGKPNEKHQKLMDRALRSVNRLTHLINDVLDINRIESGRMVLEKSDVHFEGLVKNAIHESQPAAEQKKITIQSEGLNEPYPIHVDVGKMERVAGELIGNAIKYTPEVGTVEVDLKKDDNRYILSVRDSGIGMTKEECGKIWERFYRTAASQKFAKGSGLGLSIAKELVEMHNGTLNVESETGSGSTFTLILPA